MKKKVRIARFGEEGVKKVETNAKTVGQLLKETGAKAGGQQILINSEPVEATAQIQDNDIITLTAFARQG